jgi:hypothetical protein
LCHCGDIVQYQEIRQEWALRASLVWLCWHAISRGLMRVLQNRPRLVF